MNNKKGLGRAALLLATLIWGLSFVLMDFALDSVPTFYILAIRFSGAAVILLALGARELKKLDKTYLGYGALMGVLLVAAYAFQTFGLALTTPGKNAFLTSVYCIIVPFLYWIFVRKRPDKYNITAGFMCVAGVGLISLNGRFAVSLGDGLTLVCGFLYGLHMIVIGKAVENRSPVLISTLQFAFAGAIAWILGLLTETFPSSVPTGAVWNLAFLTVMSTALCLSLQIFGQKYTPTTQASIIMALEAVFGAAASVVFGLEVLTPKLLAGFALTFASVIVSETKLSFLRKKSVREMAP